MKRFKPDVKLPEFSKQILYRTKDGWLIGAFYRHSHKFISNGNKEHKSDVIEWCELPEINDLTHLEK